MRLFELLKAAFNRPSHVQPAQDNDLISNAKQIALVEHNYQQVYTAEYLAKSKKAGAPFMQLGSADFTAFLYQPTIAAFLTQEIIPASYGIMQDGSYHLEHTQFLDYSHWPVRNPLNFPGPFYTGESDTCGTGEVEAPANVLNDHHYCEFLFRQPQNLTELFQVLDAAAVEVLDSYSCDGNQRWTYALCSEWWRSKSLTIKNLSNPMSEKNNGSRATLYLDYLNGPAEADLRKYCYFLEHGFYPNAAQSLPPL